jgi:pilus assembly protein CpaE
MMSDSALDLQDQPGDPAALAAETPAARYARAAQVEVTTVLMVSGSPIVLEYFERSSQSSPDTRVTTRCATLEALLEKEGPEGFDFDIIVFETTEGDAGQIAALRKIAALRAGRSRFLALADRQLSLAHAGALIKAGVEEVLPLATVMPELAPVPAKASAPGAYASLEGVVVAVAKSRGGVGGTTTAVNLAHALQTEAKPAKGARPKKVAVVDFDLQTGAVGAFLDLEDNGSVIEMLREGEVPDANFLRASVLMHASGLGVLPAPTELAPVDALSIPMIEAMVERLREHFDYVVIDLPTVVLPSLGALLSKCSQIIMVTDTSVPAIRQTSRLLNTFAQENITLPVEVVIAGEAKPFRLPASLQEASELLGLPFTHWVPREDKLARRAVDLGKPVAEVAKRSGMAKAYRRLADALILAHGKKKLG